MQKTIATYTVNVLAEAGQISAQILFYGTNNAFVGRIDFYKTDTVPPTSYLWHPTSTTDENQIYLVLAMRIEQFEVVASLIRNEGPWIIELWPSKSPLAGASTPGYAGKIFTSTKEPIGEEERSFQSGITKS